MKQLSTVQNVLYVAGAVLMIVGAALFAWRRLEACVVYVAGVLLYASMQFVAAYLGSNFVIQRLRRQQLFGAFCLVASAVAMAMLMWDLCRGSFMFRYVHHNEWVMLMAIGALVQLYTAYRIPKELEKEAKR
ncbi:MAG: hypothetical protein LUC44_01125 [Prevotellaceae bacterium]|nr:hypothetical protein [Prevotellaceae bacterium]